MTERYSDIAFTETVKAIQREQGSRDAYARRNARSTPDKQLGPAEREFIVTRDGFYIASVSETGWPYVQFRGGPKGFLRATREDALAFPDFNGNGQYITTGNIASDDRVALFLIDYPSRTRLKLFGRMRAVERDADPALVDGFAMPGYPAAPERAFLITVEAFDWNCPRYITPRYTLHEIVEDGAFRNETRALRTGAQALGG